MKYTHLTQEQRYHISAYKAAGFKQKEIAQKIGVHPSTVSREMGRSARSGSGDNDNSFSIPLHHATYSLLRDDRTIGVR